VADTIAILDEEDFGAHLPIADRLRQEKLQTVEITLSAMDDAFGNSKGTDRAKMVTRFAADCYFQHKALQALGAVAGFVCNKGPNARRMNFVTDLIGSDSEFAVAGENIAWASEEIEAVVQKSLQEELVQLSQAMPQSNVAQQVGAFAPTLRTIEEIFKDVALAGYKIPLSNAALCQEVKESVAWLLKEANVVIDKKMIQLYGSKWIIENGLKKRVSMKINHIVNYEVVFNKNNKLGLLEIEFKGGHLHGSTQTLKDKGLIRIIDKRQLPTGCWEYQCEDVFTGRPFAKTEFNVSWDQEMIIKRSWDLLENPLIAEYSTKDGKIAKYIKMGEDELTIVMKKHEQDINIVTAVPYKIEKKTL